MDGSSSISIILKTLGAELVSTRESVLADSPNFLLMDISVGGLSRYTGYEYLFSFQDSSFILESGSALQVLEKNL
jgi:hypothetical protein